MKKKQYFTFSIHNELHGENIISQHSRISIQISFILVDVIELSDFDYKLAEKQKKFLAQWFSYYKRLPLV